MQRVINWNNWEIFYSVWSYCGTSHQLGEEFCLSSKWGAKNQYFGQHIGWRNRRTAYYLSWYALGAKSKSKFWNVVLEKCEKKLVNWKSRLTLINSVLDAMPTSIWCPYSLCQWMLSRNWMQLEGIFSGNCETKKIYLVKWDTGITTRRKVE